MGFIYENWKITAGILKQKCIIVQFCLSKWKLCLLILEALKVFRSFEVLKKSKVNKKILKKPWKSLLAKVTWVATYLLCWIIFGKNTSKYTISVNLVKICCFTLLCRLFEILLFILYFIFVGAITLLFSFYNLSTIPCSQ